MTTKIIIPSIMKAVALTSFPLIEITFPVYINLNVNLLVLKRLPIPTNT